MNLIDYFNDQRIYPLVPFNWYAVFEQAVKPAPYYFPNLHYQGPLRDKTIYCPQKETGGTDFSDYAGCEYSLKNIDELISHPTGRVLLHSLNYAINQIHFVSEYNPEITPATKNLWTNYILLKNGFTFYIVPGMFVQKEKTEHEPASDYDLQMSEAIRQMILMESEILNKKK